MKKAYIKLYSVMNVNILFTPLTPCSDLFVRIMVVYASQDDMHLATVRCNNHNVANEKTNGKLVIILHIHTFLCDF